MENRSEYNRNEHIRKPEWLKVSLGNSSAFSRTENIMRTRSLHTICKSGRCPNLGECWNLGMATFMIAGDVCTRSCKFCNTKTGRPLPLDPGEPGRVADSVKDMNLKHVVLTSVDRDDLPDYGAEHWAKTIRCIRAKNPGVTMECLIPDFRGERSLLDVVIKEAPEIISHNLETVERLTPAVRSVARYRTSLEVLKYISKREIRAKSGIMVGLGESPEEVARLMDDLLEADCRLLTIGQYLQPSPRHMEVKEYIHPDRFAEYKRIAYDKGFIHVVSAPLARSSYHSIDFLH